MDGQSGWSSFGHIQRVPECPWPDNMGGDAGSHRGESVSAPFRPHQGVTARLSPRAGVSHISPAWLHAQGHVCEGHVCEGHVCACTGSRWVPLEVAFTFSTVQAGLEANPKP